MLDTRSQSRLAGVHPDLAAIVNRAAEICPVRFIVTEGLRTMERQRALVAKGASKTLRSRHLTGHAIDVCVLTAGRENWANEAYIPVARAMKKAAEEMGLSIEWGGDWKTFVDTPHFQLPWSLYPAGDLTSRARRQMQSAYGEPEASWLPETHVATEPEQPASALVESMAQSSTGNTAITIGGASIPQYGTAVAQAAAGGGGMRDFLIRLACDPLFWTATVTIAGAVYIWLERRAKLLKWGI